MPFYKTMRCAVACAHKNSYDKPKHILLSKNTRFQVTQAQPLLIYYCASNVQQALRLYPTVIHNLLNSAHMRLPGSLSCPNPGVRFLNRSQDYFQTK